MAKEKAEIASFEAKNGKVQSLMKYVKGTLKEAYQKQPKGKAIGVDGIVKGRIRRKLGSKYRCTA